MGYTVNHIVKSFGHIVGSNVEKRPAVAQILLKLGYRAAYAYCAAHRYFPSGHLLPSQIYAAQTVNELISRPLFDPQGSAVVNIFFPCELLHVAGVKPQVAEGLAGYLNGACCEHFFIDYAERCGISKTLCSFHKALLGAAFSRVLPKPRFVMFTTMVCDANLVTSKALSDLWGIPLFTIDVPSGDGEDAVDYVENQLRRAIEFIEDNAKRKFDYDRLREAISSQNRSMRMYREYLKLLSAGFMPNDLTSEMYRLLFTYVLSGTKESETYFKMLLDDARMVQLQGNSHPRVMGNQRAHRDQPRDEGARGNRRLQETTDCIRVLWCHTVPYWQTSLREFFSQSRYQLLCSDLNLDGLVDLNEDKPLRSLAIKLVNNRLRGPAERSARNILAMARYLNADGVIYFNSWGCKRTLGGSAITEKLLEESGIPVLVLDGDGCDRNNINDGQMKTRVEAFLEILEARK